MKYVNFGQAIEALKQGKVVKRDRWNGVNMSLVLKKGSRDISDDTVDELPPGSDTIEGVPFDLFDVGDVGTITRLPNINMVNTNGRIVTGWLASQTDMLAEDWIILD